MELNFDIKKIKVVPIGQIKPNPWNPKVKKGKEYAGVLQSVETNGLRLPIVVRELKENQYQIIDGEQRWTACSDLKFKEVIIYNEGKLSDQEAKQLTIWYQQQVPFDELELAELVRDIIENQTQDVELPYTQQELDDLLKLTNFSFDDYDKEMSEEKEKAKIECPSCGHTFHK